MEPIDIYRGGATVVPLPYEGDIAGGPALFPIKKDFPGEVRGVIRGVQGSDRNNFSRPYGGIKKAGLDDIFSSLFDIASTGDVRKEDYDNLQKQYQREYDDYTDPKGLDPFSPPIDLAAGRSGFSTPYADKQYQIEKYLENIRRLKERGLLGGVKTALNQGPSTPVKYYPDLNQGQGGYMPHMGGTYPANVRPKRGFV